MRIYQVTCDFGVGLIAAKSLPIARRLALKENGTSHFRSIKRATAQDVAWVRGMGGYVPKGKVDPDKLTVETP